MLAPATSQPLRLATTTTCSFALRGFGRVKNVLKSWRLTTKVRSLGRTRILPQPNTTWLRSCSLRPGRAPAGHGQICFWSAGQTVNTRPIIPKTEVWLGRLRAPWMVGGSRGVRCWTATMLLCRFATEWHGTAWPTVRSISKSNWA